jgi:hypothetical protein
MTKTWEQLSWRNDFRVAIYNYNLKEKPISKSKANEVNNFLLERYKTCGIVCKINDYLTYYDPEIIKHPRDSHCIAMNIDAFTDVLHWARYVPCEPVDNREVIRAGLYGYWFGVPIVVNNKLEKITK